MKIPERGDIVAMDFSPTVGHEQGGYRPAIVLTESDFNREGMVFVCPITNTERGHFFEIKINTDNTKGVVLAYHLRAIDYVSRKGKIVDKVDKKTLDEVLDKVKIILE
jgi:mRNA interferase MazF